MIARADPDDAVTFIDSLPEERRERIIALLDPERRAEVRELISYPEGSVGRIMTTDFMTFLPSTTAQGAIDRSASAENWKRSSISTWLTRPASWWASSPCGIWWWRRRIACWAT